MVSPFVAIGSIPFLLVAGILGIQYSIVSPQIPAWRRWLSAQTVAGAVLLLIQGLFFLAMGSGPPTPSDAPGELWPFRFLAVHSWSKFGELARFELLEFSLLALVVCLSRSLSTRRLRIVAVTAIVYLTALPFFHYGKMNDLVNRSSIPALFALCILIGRTLTGPTVKRLWKTALIFLLFVGMFTGVVEVKRHLTGLSWDEVARRSFHPNAAFDLNDANNCANPQKNENDWFIRQYLGHSDSVFFRWVARTGANVDKLGQTN